MTYEDISLYLQTGSVITFREYLLDRHERKKLNLEIENVVVHDIIPEGKALNREELETYYGEGLDDVDYQQLSCMNCLRVVLILEIGENDQPVYKTISIIRDFVKTGLQEVEMLYGATQEVEPIYTAQMLNFGCVPVFSEQDNKPIRVPIISQ